MITLRDIRAVQRLNPTIEHIEHELPAIVNSIGQFPGVFWIELNGIDSRHEIEISVGRVGSDWRLFCEETGMEKIALREASFYAKAMFVLSVNEFFLEWRKRFEPISELSDVHIGNAERSLEAMLSSISKKGA